MKSWPMKPQHYVIASVISFLIAAISFSGLVLRDDIWGRLIVGAVWSLVGVGWFSRYTYLKLEAREWEIRDLRQSLLARVRDTAAQEERNRLARELHDSIKQQIFGIRMGTAAMEARWESDPRGAREALGDVQRSAQEAMAEMNALLQQLAPAPLEKVGLVQALRDQCEALGYRSGAEVAAQFGDLPADERLPAGAQESLFRIAQEAFSNVARHARARHVHLYLGQRDTDGPLTLEIEDDGQGFQMGQVGDGMGLENIRQRVRTLGGKLALESAPDRGTTVSVRIPLVEPVTAGVEAGPEHPLNKVFMVGLVGGIALIAALFYPLYVLAPGGAIAGWPPGWPAMGLLLEIAALPLAGGIGWLAARWAGGGTRQYGTLFGALAGGVAGAVLFFGLGAPAAAVTGWTAVLRGLVPAVGRTEAIHFLAGSAIGIVGWSHAAFWAALVSGVGLGALGGLLAPPAKTPSLQQDLRPAAGAILTAAAVVSALSLLVAVSRFALLEPTIREGLRVNGATLQTALPLERLSDWLIGTPLLLYLGLLTAKYLLLRAEIRCSRDPARMGAAPITAAFFALLSFGMPLYLGLAGFPTLPRRPTVLLRGWMDLTGLPHPPAVTLGQAAGAHLLVPGLVCSLGIGGLYLQAMAAARRRWRATGSRATLSLNAGLGVVLGMALPAMIVVSTVVDLGLITWPLVEALIGYGAQWNELTVVECVRNVYLGQASSFLAVVVAAAAATGLAALFGSSVLSLAERWGRPASRGHTM